MTLTVQDMDDKTRLALLGEVFMDELKVIREYLEDIPAMKKRLESVDQRLANVEADVHVIKMVVTDHSRQLNNHEMRLRRLETKSATAGPS